MQGHTHFALRGGVGDPHAPGLSGGGVTEGSGGIFSRIQCFAVNVRADSWIPVRQGGTEGFRIKSFQIKIESLSKDCS